MALAWEPAYHNRERRGTTDGCVRVAARLNHACDRLAGAMVNTGRLNELNFYGGMAPQQHASNYWTKGGVPILGDPFVRVEHAANATTAARVLELEHSRAPHLRKNATRMLRSSLPLLMVCRVHWPFRG